MLGILLGLPSQNPNVSPNSENVITVTHNIPKSTWSSIKAVMKDFFQYTWWVFQHVWCNIVYINNIFTSPLYINILYIHRVNEVWFHHTSNQFVFPRMNKSGVTQQLTAVTESFRADNDSYDVTLNTIFTQWITDTDIQLDSETDRKSTSKNKSKSKQRIVLCSLTVHNLAPLSQESLNSAALMFILQSI